MRLKSDGSNWYLTDALPSNCIRMRFNSSVMPIKAQMKRILMMTRSQSRGQRKGPELLQLGFSRKVKGRICRKILRMLLKK